MATVVALAVFRGAAEVGTSGWPSADSVAAGDLAVVTGVVTAVVMAVVMGVVAAGLAAAALDGDGIVTPTEPQSCWAKARVAVGGC